MPRHYLNRSEMGPGYLRFLKSFSGDIHRLKPQILVYKQAQRGEVSISLLPMLFKFLSLFLPFLNK